MKNGKKTISVEVDSKDVKASTLDKELRPPREGSSKVSCSIGVTKSTAPYEFVRIDVSCEDFCEPEDRKALWNELYDDCVGTVGSFLIDFDHLKRRLDPKLAIDPDAPEELAIQPATTKTKAILNSDIRFYLTDQKKYPKIIEALKSVSDVFTEGKAREIIFRVRANDWGWVDEISALKKVEPEITLVGTETRVEDGREIHTSYFGSFLQEDSGDLEDLPPEISIQE